MKRAPRPLSSTDPSPEKKEDRESERGRERQRQRQRERKRERETERETERERERQRHTQGERGIERGRNVKGNVGVGGGWWMDEKKASKNERIYTVWMRVCMSECERKREVKKQG